ncbi:MAG: hypothetical protein ACR2KK_23660 [Acidimicrobiales bacterium]
MTRRPGTDAVEASALDVELPGGSGDLVVEEVEATEGLGVGVLEVGVDAPAALDLFEGLDERIAERLDAMWRETLAACPRPGCGPEVVPMARPRTKPQVTGGGR